MSQLPPASLSSPRHLADLLQLAGAGLLGDARQSREIASAIRRVGSWLTIPLDQVPTTPAVLRRHLARISHHQVGVSAGRLANVKSLLARALELAGVRPANRSVAEAVTKPWQDLLARLADEPYLKASLGPFARYCSSEDIVPDAVSDAVSRRYLEFLERFALLKAPATTHQTVCRTWEQARARIPGWPAVALATPRYACTYSLPLTAFPLSFQSDLEQYLRRLACAEAADLLSDDAPTRPLKASSIDTKRYQIRQHASALVHTGMPLEDITSLSVLTRPENFKNGLRYLLGRPRQDRANTRTAGQIAHTIRSIGKYHVRLPGVELQTLDNITRRLTQKPTGMSEKNRRRLAQFKDDVTLERFLCLAPEELDRLARKRERSHNEVLEFSLLLALEILTLAPMRIGALAGIDIDQDVRLPTEPGGEAMILIPAARSKTRQSAQYRLPPEAAAYLNFYIANVRPLMERVPQPLGSEPSRRFLFPGPSGRPKRSDTLSKQLSRLVWNRAGVEFSPHLMRHLAASMHLWERPDDHETPKRLLMHASHDTTHKMYQGLEIDSASRLHADLIRARRNYAPKINLTPKAARNTEIASNAPVRARRRRPGPIAREGHSVPGKQDR